MYRELEEWGSLYTTNSLHRLVIWEDDLTVGRISRDQKHQVFVIVCVQERIIDELDTEMDSTKNRLEFVQVNPLKVLLLV